MRNPAFHGLTRVEPIEQPNPLQRAQFIALQLLQAVQAGNEAVAAATCAYLANRIPDLQQVRATTRGGVTVPAAVVMQSFKRPCRS